MANDNYNPSIGSCNGDDNELDDKFFLNLNKGGHLSSNDISSCGHDDDDDMNAINATCSSNNRRHINRLFGSNSNCLTNSDDNEIQNGDLNDMTKRPDGSTNM